MSSRNKPLSVEEKEEIRDVYLKVGNQEKVVKLTKHGSTTVWKVLKEYGLNKGQGGNPIYKITDEQILQSISDGLTRQEIADKYGVHVENLGRRMRRLGVHANYAPRPEGVPFPKIYGECWHYVKSFDDFVKNKHPQFIYLETQQKGNSTRSRIKCKKCGNVIERSNSTIRKGNVCCEYCKEKQQQKIDLQNERIKLMRFLIAYKELKTPKICAICGAEYYSQSPNSKYCSNKCKRKNKGASVRRRCRKYNVYYDPQVKAQDVFRRDHYICKICGLECNTQDDKWGYTGPYSPSVDHIIPLAKGGTHTWDNVQCVHIICNSYKRDIFTV